MRTHNFRSYVQGKISNTFQQVIGTVENHLGVDLAKYFTLLAFGAFLIWEGIKDFVSTHWTEVTVGWAAVLVIVILRDWFKDRLDESVEERERRQKREKEEKENGSS